MTFVVRLVCSQVVGAGRGPLVQASLKAGKTAGRSLKVYAVEKNPNAVITLRNRVVMDKWENVTIVAKDMRQWVSEDVLVVIFDRSS